MREPDYSILAALSAPLKKPRIRSIAGRVFNRWTVFGFIGYSKSKKDSWLCRCTCGNWGIIRRTALQNNKSKSCGCLRFDSGSPTHGMSNTTVYSRYFDMHTRCYNQLCPAFKNYGERGIVVEDRWHTFENFYKDMGDPPTPEHQIERVNNDGNYGPDNCIWDTNYNQARNKRTNVLLTLNDETHCVADWADITGLSRNVIYKRHRKGLSDTDCLAIKER